MQRLQRVVKSYLAPLYVRCVMALDAVELPWNDADVPSDTEILNTIGAHIDDVSPELNEAFGFLLRNGLYCIGNGDGLMDMGYTTALSSYRSAFIFNKVTSRFDAFQTTVHEFGHFNAFYHDPTPMLYQYDNMDVSEIQSQALEMLFLPALQDVLAGDGSADRAVVALYALENMLGSIVDGCLYDEFEQAVYAGPDMTVRDLHALERRLNTEYGLNALYADDPYWVYIPHLFDSPCYYISYATSALPALDIWLRSLDDRDAAVDTYLTVSAARTDAWFLDVLYDNDLCDVTDRGDVVRVSEALEMQVDALIADLPTARSYTAVRIAAAMIVICGGAFLLLRLKKKKREAA